MRVFRQQFDAAVGTGHRLDRDLGFEASETGAETKMVPSAKRQMAIRGARDIEFIRVGELGWITVCGPQRQTNGRMFRDRDAPNPNVFGRPSGCRG